MIFISIQGSIPSRSRPKATEIVHYVFNKARLEFSKDASTAPKIVEQALQESFGHDLELAYLDRHGEICYPEYNDSFIIVINDQYRVPTQ